MIVADLLREGKLRAAVDAAILGVKATPGDVTARIRLFELLAATGSWDRATKHLDVITEKEPSMIEAVLSYKGVLAAEQVRTAIFAQGKGTPTQMCHFLLNPEPTLSAVRAAAAGRSAEASRLATNAIDAQPARPGTVNGRCFDDLRDADDLLAPVLEVIGNGHYGWIPFDQLRRIELAAPASLRDLLWRPATLTLTDGASAALFLPTRYPGSESHPDESIQLARSTDWLSTPEGPTRGIGQRTLLADGEPYGILDITDIVFDG